MNIEKNAKLKWRRIYWNGKGYDMTKKIEIKTLHDERRDMFAAAALTGILACDCKGRQRIYVIPAVAAFEYADAMIEASKKTANEKTD